MRLARSRPPASAKRNPRTPELASTRAPLRCRRLAIRPHLQRSQIMAATVTEGERYQRLLNSLSKDLFQTEMSAPQHCRREAERLGDTAPADALRGVAIHAESVLQE